MAGSAERAAELAKKMMEQSALPFNDGYLPPSDPAFDFRSQIHALRDPVYRNRHDNSEKGEQLYQLFNDGNMEEFYEMYFRADTMPLAKFCFFYQILRNENTRIHDPYYKSIKDEIRRQLFETPPPPEIQSDLYKMLSDADNGREQPTPLQLASFFIGRVNPSGREALERELGRKGGKRHSKIKRKSKMKKRAKVTKKSHTKKSHRKRSNSTRK
jgi:hypothetical protein